MSRWHRVNPEKGNQVEPDSSASLFMEADAMRKGEIPMHPPLGEISQRDAQRYYAALYRIAWEPIGDPEATSADILDEVERIAKAALSVNGGAL